MRTKVDRTKGELQEETSSRGGVFCLWCRDHWLTAWDALKRNHFKGGSGEREYSFEVTGLDWAHACMLSGSSTHNHFQVSWRIWIACMSLSVILVFFAPPCFSFGCLFANRKTAGNTYNSRNKHTNATIKQTLHLKFPKNYNMCVDQEALCNCIQTFILQHNSHSFQSHTDCGLLLRMKTQCAEEQ